MCGSFLFKDKYNVQVERFEATQQQKSEITFILLPAIGVPIQKYQRFINHLNQVGYHVVTADYPCCGINHPHIDKDRDYGYKDLVTEFIPNLLKFAKSEKNILLGHSLGGHLATLYATQNTISIIGIATGNIHYKNWPGLAKLNILRAVGLFKLLTNFYGYLPGHKIGFGLKEAKTLIHDWCHTALTGNYDFFTPQHKKAKGHAVYIHIKGDHFAPYQSTKKLAEMFRSYSLESIELNTQLKGNKHSIWLKEPNNIVYEIKKKIG